MGIFNELSRDFNSGFNPAENLGQVLELMNKYSKIRTRTGAFNPIIYNSWHEKQEVKVMPKTVSVDEIEDAINQSTRPQAGFVEMSNNNMTQSSFNAIETNNVKAPFEPTQSNYNSMQNGTVQANYQPVQNDAVLPSNVNPAEKETEDIMDM